MDERIARLEKEIEVLKERTEYFHRDLVRDNKHPFSPIITDKPVKETVDTLLDIRIVLAPGQSVPILSFPLT